jgi:hypothetical protein
MASPKNVEYLPNPGGQPLVLLHYKDLLDDNGKSIQFVQVYLFPIFFYFFFQEKDSNFF